MSVIELRDVSVTFHERKRTVEAVKHVSLTVDKGEIFGIVGFSGAGKSTLVRTINLLERPTGGTVLIDGKDVTNVSGAELRDLRKRIGFIFQGFNLITNVTVGKNIEFALKAGGYPKEQWAERVRELLALVGLENKIDSYPSSLSGGQKQRVSIARALANKPEILLCDEATSALDLETTEGILELLRHINKELGITIVIITHEMAVIKTIADRMAVMEGGKIVEEGTVYDIFSDPQAPITRKFIASSSPLGKIDKLISENSSLTQVKKGEILAKLIFQKDCVGEHILTTMAQRYGVNLNIILANVEYLHGNPLGGTIGILSGDAKSIEAGIRFLEENHVRTDVLKYGRVD